MLLIKRIVFNRADINSQFHGQTLYVGPIFYEILCACLDIYGPRKGHHISKKRRDTYKNYSIFFLEEASHI